MAALPPAGCAGPTLPAAAVMAACLVAGAVTSRASDTTTRFRDMQRVNALSFLALAAATTARRRACGPGRLPSLLTGLVLLAAWTARASQPGGTAALSSRAVRVDAALATLGSLLFVTRAYYAFAPRHTLWTHAFFALFVLLALPALGTVPMLVGAPRPDRAALRRAAQLCTEAYAVRDNDGMHVYDPDADVACLVSSAPGSADVYVAFAGTRSEQNVKLDLKFVDATVPSEWLGRAAGASVKMHAHAGFVTGYAAVRERLLARLQPALADGAGGRLFVCGHSLGGALATLAGADLALNAPLLAQAGARPPSVHVYTFGSPAVGDGLFARTFDAAVAESVRVVNPFDWVPRVLSPQLVHVAGQYPVAGLTQYTFTAAHRMATYQTAVSGARGVSLLAAFLPMAYLAAALAGVLLWRRVT